MDSFSPIHWLIILAIFAIPLPALIKILRRMGISGWCSILYFVPIGNWIGLWMLASARWPNADEGRQVDAS